MVWIPICDYNGYLKDIFPNIKITGQTWTGKTIRLTVCDSKNKDETPYYCYIVYPQLPKVRPDDWSLKDLWGSEIDESVLKQKIQDNEYTFRKDNDMLYLVVICLINELKKKDVLDEDNIIPAQAIEYVANHELKWNLDSTIGNSKQIANQVDVACAGFQVVSNELDELRKHLFVKQEEYQSLKGKEQKTMNGLFDEIKVGKASRDYSITYFGTVAFKGKTYYKDKIFDATGMTINFDMLYLVPASEVKAGDIVDKNSKAYYVKGVNNGVVNAIDLLAGTEENLVPGGPFGMTLYSKIFNPFGAMKGENAFGNMLMLQALNDNGGGNNGMLMAMMMMQGGFKLPTFEMPNFPATNEKKVVDKDKA